MVGKVGELAQDIGGAFGQMLPSMAVGVIAPTAGVASFGVQAGLQGYGQARDEGASYEDAVRNGVATGVMEAGIEKATGGMGRVFGKGYLDKAIKMQPNSSKKAVLANTARGAVGEGAEEVVSGFLDPPYNTGNDFVYEDDFSQSTNEYLANSGQYDESGNRLVTNTENNGRFHTDWLNMIYSRLRIAKDLLAEDGAIFISIDDNEMENLTKLCNEIFGESNFIANLIWKSKSGGANDSRFFAVDHEYILVYAKSADAFKLEIDKEATVTTSYNRCDGKGEYALDRLDKQSIRYSEALDYEIIGPDGTSYYPKHKDPAHPNATWRWSKKNVAEHYDDLVFENGCVYTKNYKKEGAIARSLLLEDRFGRTRTGKKDCFALFNRDYFSNPKPYKLIRYLEIIALDKDSIILDFFSGSATTAHATMQLNAEDGGHRKFILVQLPEETTEKSEAYKAGYKNICEIGKERIRRAGQKIRAEIDIANKNDYAALVQSQNSDDQQIMIGFNSVRNSGVLTQKGYTYKDKKTKEISQVDYSIENPKNYYRFHPTELDIGFRVLKCDTSNMKDVYYRPDEVEQDLFDNYANNIKEDRTVEDLLFQVMLDLGILLSSKIEETTIAGCKVFNVAEGFLYACFDNNISDDVVKAIANEQPYYAVFRDSGMASDSVLTNFDQIFAAISPSTVRKVL